MFSLPNAVPLRVGAGVLALMWLVSCQIDKLFQSGGASAPPATRLEFAAPPNATAGEPLSPAVRVSAVDGTGALDTTFHGAVTVTLGENPGRGTLRGTGTVDAVRGVASFADLSINRPGTGYTLVATSPGVRGATSPAFDVAPAAAARLAFTTPPHNATVDSVIKPPVQVTALDTLGNVATSFAANVTVALGPASNGGTLGGTPTVAAVSGVATFADLRVNRAGTAYRLTASADQLAGATSDAFEIAAGPPTTGDLTVTTSTTGANLPTSYTVTVDGSQNRTIPANGGTTTYSGLSATTHTVALTDVPTKNCTVSGGASHTVTVAAGETATEHFSISCAATTGSLSVTTSTSGQSQDPDGYTFAVDNGTPQPIGVNQTITVTPVAAGSHTVVLAGVAGNCTVANGPSQTVTVPEGGSVEAAFSITCTQLTGSVTVTTSTSGGTPDPDGYTVAVTGAASQHIDPNGTATFANLATGNHTVTLSGIASNCSVTGGPSRPVTVITGQTVSVPFTIDCSTATGTLNVTTSTSGDRPDPNGYTFTVDNGTPQPIQISQTVPLTLPAGSHTVQLGDVASNCTVTNGTSRTVTVPAGGAASASFTVSCPTATGTLNVTTSTSGDSPDPNGYTFTVDNGTPQPIQISQTVPLTLPAGSHTVQLGDVASNCTVTNGTSRTVTVPAGGAVSASFTVSCPTATGTLNVTTSTSGDSPDPNGYTFTVDNGTPQPIQISQTVPLTLPAGSHTVQLGDVASNCTVTNGTSRTVTVPAGGAVSASFTVSCPTATGTLN